MSVIFSKNGFRALRLSVAVTLSGVAVAVFLAGSSYWYWQSEKRGNQTSSARQQDSRARLETARRERDDLRDSEQTYKVLTTRGVFQPEQRLELVEAFAALKTRHQLVALEYEVQPQRPLKLNTSASLPAVDVFGSRIKFKARANHDGDLVAFLDEFPRMQRGFFPLDRCVIKRTSESESAKNVAPIAKATGLQAAVSAIASLTGLSTPQANIDADETSLEGILKPRAPQVSKTDSAALEADCSLEWITLVDKQKIADSPTLGGPAKRSR